ncbi:GPCR-chaperone-domain-containing protein [Phlyctochytrium arcticum]|nr:GPCR-chaperone-domain-containing protein [Phlyctochytrium arcticum]
MRNASDNANGGDPYYIHKLIYNNDVARLRTFLSLPSNPSDPPQSPLPPQQNDDPGPPPHPALSSVCRGQTPLTLALALDHAQCVHALLEAGASTIVKNAEGWTPFQEACSRGNRDAIEVIYRWRRRELARWFSSKGMELLKGLSQDLKDFYLEMHWSFRSIIPFISSLCPSDTYKIYKKDKSLRIDTTLVGFENLSWIRGDISIIFTDHETGPTLVICDHQRRLVQRVWPRDFTIGDKDIEEEISLNMNTKMVTAPEFDFTSFSLSRSQTGFWTFKTDRNEQIGPWQTRVWSVDSLQCISKTRTEHLLATPLPPIPSLNPDFKEEDLPAPEAPDEDELIRQYDAGEWHGWKSVDQDPQPNRIMTYLTRFRPTLDPPPESDKPAFDVFFAPGEEKDYLHPGRALALETSSRKYTATLWMYESSEEERTRLLKEGEAAPSAATATQENEKSGGVGRASPTSDLPSLQSEEFPIKIETVLPLLELLGMGTNHHVQSLKEFFNIQLPPGFPVQVEIPIGMLPLSTLITFRNISSTLPIEADMFRIPTKKDGYRFGEVIKGSEGQQWAASV